MTAVNNANLISAQNSAVQQIQPVQMYSLSLLPWQKYIKTQHLLRFQKKLKDNLPGLVLRLLERMSRIKSLRFLL